MNESYLAYAAGIIDGEGSVGVSRKQGSVVADGRRGSHKLSFHLLVQVSMKIPTKIPKWLYDNFGGYYGEYAQGERAWGSGIVAKWSLHGSSAQEFLSVIRPYLLDKAERADFALAFPIARSSHKGAAETEMQKYIYNEMKKLQSKLRKK